MRSGLLRPANNRGGTCPWGLSGLFFRVFWQRLGARQLEVHGHGRQREVGVLQRAPERGLVASGREAPVGGMVGLDSPQTV